MNWEIGWGARKDRLKQLQTIRDIALEEGRFDDIPAFLKNRPTLSQFEQLYYEAFSSLSDSRQWSAVGPLGIPYDQVSKYLDDHQIYDTDERDEYHQLIQRLDDVYVAHALKKGPTGGN